MAVTILSLALLVYVSVAVAARVAADKGSFETIAAQAAAGKIAECQGQAYDNLTAGTTTYTVANIPSGVMTVAIGPLDGSNGNKRMWQIDVTVTWSARGSQSPQTAGRLHYCTLISKRL